MAGNGLRRELQNRNFIQWCNTLGNTRRITKLPVGGYCSCFSLLSTRILSLVPYPTQKRIFPFHLRISLSFFLLSFVFSFLFIYSLPPPLSLSLLFSSRVWPGRRDLVVRLPPFRRGGPRSPYRECLRFALRWSIK